ncbi:hypothetical protein [Schaalia vaccimaxillae]|nr:hypothetical protein [Schaalia vaccimaxillae]
MCGIDTTGTGPNTELVTTDEHYSVWITVRTTTDPQNFTIVDFGRNFS